MTKLEVRLRESPTSRTLRAKGETQRAHLEAEKGAAFDKAYVDHAVAYHQLVIDALDT